MNIIGLGRRNRVKAGQKLSSHPSELHGDWEQELKNSIQRKSFPKEIFRKSIQPEKAGKSN